MKTDARTPKWAAELTERVCRDYGRRPAIIRTWRTRPQSYSSGATWHRDRSITITAGTDKLEQRTVLLHELAHYLVRPKHHHDKVFWWRAWELHGVYGDLATAWRVESEYKQKAITYAPSLVRAAFS